jgi:hypothetical protein
VVLGCCCVVSGTLSGSLSIVDTDCFRSSYVSTHISAYSAKRPDVREKFGITHILTVCPDFPSTGPHHMALDVGDWEFENLLIQFLPACRFIQSALESKSNRVLVHCYYGISRSATIVCAYRDSESSLFHFKDILLIDLLLF